MLFENTSPSLIHAILILPRKNESDSPKPLYFFPVHVILFSTILSTIGTLNLFTEAYLLTNGGPNNSTITLGLYIYRQAFQSLNLTYAATISVAILVVVGVLSRLQMKFGGNSK